MVCYFFSPPFLWLVILSLGRTSFVCCVYRLCVVLQELQKAKAARGTARAQSSLAMEEMTLKAPSGAAEVQKSMEPMPTPADPEV